MGWVSKMEDDFERSEQDFLPVPPLPEPIMTFERQERVICPPSYMSQDVLQEQPERSPTISDDVPDFRDLQLEKRRFIAREVARNRGLEVIDKTNRIGGHLWIIVDTVSAGLLERRFGMKYVSTGGRASRHRPACFL